MHLLKLLEEKFTYCNLYAGSKKKFLRTLSDIVADQFPELTSDEVFNGLNHREKLGSTGIGQGVAIPHCRLDKCQHLIGILTTLSEPIDFDAIDTKKVDLIFVLLAPSKSHQDHLETLSQVVSLLNEPRARMKLRRTKTGSELYNSACKMISQIPDLDASLSSA